MCECVGYGGFLMCERDGCVCECVGVWRVVMYECERSVCVRVEVYVLCEGVVVKT